ncbi:hypothetical protein [Telluria beijingensis]|uniref:hypothetical protein n=1 Tax=Telluria beijingensis TaxID=3068633 RepID=UPI0027956E6C|nr:hypothetical protein [Massilia sp. REN29]
MATFVKSPSLAKAVLNGVHKFASDTFKAALTNTLPAPTALVLADITQVSGGAYLAGGYVLDGVTLSDAAGVAKVAIADEVITAAGAAVGPLRYAVVYNDTAAGKPLVGHVDYGSSITLGDGEILTLDFDPDAGVLTLT